MTDIWVVEEEQASADTQDSSSANQDLRFWANNIIVVKKMMQVFGGPKVSQQHKSNTTRFNVSSPTTETGNDRSGLDD